jgi:hypothetical protein
MAKGEFNQKVGQGVSNGVKDAQAVIGTTLGKLNIFGIDKLADTIGYIIFGLGTLAVLGYGVSLISGTASGLVNRRPLPASASWTARVGHAVGSTVGTVGGYTLQGVAASADQLVRYETVGQHNPLNPFDNRYPAYRNSDAYQPPVTPYTNLPNGGFANTNYQYGVPVYQGQR